MTGMHSIHTSSLHPALWDHAQCCSMQLCPPCCTCCHPSTLPMLHQLPSQAIAAPARDYAAPRSSFALSSETPIGRAAPIGIRSSEFVMQSGRAKPKVATPRRADADGPLTLCCKCCGSETRWLLSRNSTSQLRIRQLCSDVPCSHASQHFVLVDVSSILRACCNSASIRSAGPSPVLILSSADPIHVRSASFKRSSCHARRHRVAQHCSNTHAGFAAAAAGVVMARRVHGLRRAGPRSAGAAGALRHAARAGCEDCGQPAGREAHRLHRQRSDGGSADARTAEPGAHRGTPGDACWHRILPVALLGTHGWARHMQHVPAMPHASRQLLRALPHQQGFRVAGVQH